MFQIDAEPVQSVMPMSAITGSIIVAAPVISPVVPMTPIRAVIAAIVAVPRIVGIARIPPPVIGRAVVDRSRKRQTNANVNPGHRLRLGKENKTRCGHQKNKQSLHKITFQHYATSQGLEQK